MVEIPSLFWIKVFKYESAYMSMVFTANITVKSLLLVPIVVIDILYKTDVFEQLYLSRWLA